MLAHKNEPVKQKDKKNSTAGKRSTVFLVMPPLRSTPRGDINKQKQWKEENWWANSTATAGMAGKNDAENGK